MTFAIRTSGDPLVLEKPVRRVVQEMDANAPVYEVLAADEYVSRSVGTERFNLMLIGAFASLALIMTAVGLYGVISYSVTQRTREIGIRVALGAGTRETVGIVMGRGLRLTVSGVVLGLAAAFALSRFLEHLLFGVTPTDPLTFASVALLLLFVAIVACYLPARRASRIDPMVALRSE
jgi:ABC-type antimicrobial peptide transport system permease subunit